MPGKFDQLFKQFLSHNNSLENERSGPVDGDIAACLSLSKAFSELGAYTVAIDCLEAIVSCVKKEATLEIKSQAANQLAEIALSEEVQEDSRAYACLCYLGHVHQEHEAYDGIVNAMKKLFVLDHIMSFSPYPGFLNNGQKTACMQMLLSYKPSETEAKKAADNLIRHFSHSTDAKHAQMMFDCLTITGFSNSFHARAIATIAHGIKADHAEIESFCTDMNDSFPDNWEQGECMKTFIQTFQQLAAVASR